ncbi:hypothetical protein MSAN_00620200 [Mycena sanguinolenta]|uniref:Uncharacterized protein n=1 Tax=Mycena sanguinolenta TaxID=230812 RepID=A0A8H6Z3B4_9AGAR|nr:hypothetical protein MSAN_00620200 [Mycena sanguinolenta]
MGGFVSSDGHPIVTRKQLEDPEFLKAIQNVDEEDIKDRSKGDAFSKGVALLQGLWFTVQCVARVHQRLAVTQLEVATLAFAVVNTFIWLLWWDKPLNVQRPIVVGPLIQPDTETITLPVQLSHCTRFWGAIFGDYNYGHKYKPLSSVSVPSFWSVDKEPGFEAILLLGVGTLFGAIHCAAWNAVFPTDHEMWIWRTSSLVIIAVPCLSLLLSPLSISDRLGFAFGAIMLLGIAIYIAARLILIGLPFAELRSLPASAFADVNWSTYIPHI